MRLTSFCLICSKRTASGRSGTGTTYITRVTRLMFLFRHHMLQWLTPLEVYGEFKTVYVAILTTLLDVARPPTTVLTLLFPCSFGSLIQRISRGCRFPTLQSLFLPHPSSLLPQPVQQLFNVRIPALLPYSIFFLFSLIRLPVTT